MIQLLKPLIPERALKRLRAWRVAWNRHSIARAARNQIPLTIVPDNLVEHYYHFIFDLVLPLHLAVLAAGDAARFTVRTTHSPFIGLLDLLFDHRVLVTTAPDGTGLLSSRRLLGMNPFLVQVSPGDVLSLAQHVKSKLRVDSDVAPRAVLLIERLPPTEFYNTAAVKKGGGARRRCITNHEELAEAIAAVVLPPLEFHNVQLEVLSFEEQVRLFARAALVIGQHGAGLANCLWMRPGCRVVELNHDPGKSHFQTLAGLMQHHHLTYPTDSTHTRVDAPRFLQWMKNHGLPESSLLER